MKINTCFQNKILKINTFTWVKNVLWELGHLHFTICLLPLSGHETISFTSFVIPETDVSELEENPVNPSIEEVSTSKCEDNAVLR